MTLDSFAEDQPAAKRILKKDRLGKIADLLENSGIDLEDIGRVEKVRLNEWQGFSKDDDGNPVVTDLSGISVILSPAFESGPKWPVVAPAKPVTIRATKRPAPKRDHHVAVIFPDQQFGYRMLADGSLDPFHDDHALDVAEQISAYLRPEKQINLGDLNDFASFGRFLQEPGFQATTQAGLDRAHIHLAQQRAASPDGEIIVLEGNHDARISKAIITNALAAYGLRTANAPASWPVLSVPNLLRFDELGIEYASGYPAAEVWINDRIRAIHGYRVKSAGSTASLVVDDERVSTLFGHVHRIELQHTTRHTKDGPRQNLAATPGCLCRIDGAVPSMKGAVDVLGRPIRSYENWQQGIAVVSYQPGDSDFALELVPIISGVAYFRGMRFESTVESC